MIGVGSCEGSILYAEYKNYRNHATSSPYAAHNELLCMQMQETRMTRATGRHFLQIPGPTNVPDRVLRAIDFPTMDHRSPDFGLLGRAVLEGMQRVFKTASPVVIYPASGTGAWEAALVNTLSPGDRVLMYETGHFATLWQAMAQKLGLDVEFVPGDWRRGADPA